MSNKKLSEEELQQLRDFQGQDNQIIFALGQLTLRDVLREEQKESLIKDYKALMARQETLGRDLQEKYGEGNIDLDTGEITLVK